MRTNCSGLGAFLWDFTKALFLHICVYLYISPLWRRCFPSGFHQSPRLVHSRLLTGFCLSRVCGWFFGLVACFWQCFYDVWHHVVIMAIAYITPLFRWLKGAPPGTYPSSNQQKKASPWHFSALTSSFFTCGLDAHSIRLLEVQSWGILNPLFLVVVILMGVVQIPMMIAFSMDSSRVDKFPSLDFP